MNKPAPKKEEPKPADPAQPTKMDEEKPASETKMDEEKKWLLMFVYSYPFMNVINLSLVEHTILNFYNIIY